MKLWYLGDVTPVFLEPALRYLFVLVASLAVLPASAILIRPDRDDAEYLEMATRYLSAVRLEPVDAEGVLIAPRWILTDAGNAQQLEDMKPRPRLRIGKGEHEIQAIYFSDHWVLGLVLLKSAVAGVVSTPLYRADDEAGKTVIMVSHGATGMIGGSATSRDNRARAAINTVPSVTSRYFGLQIMPPEEASDLQGAATYTDRGSPAYIETKEGIFVAGIAWEPNPDRMPKIMDRNLYIRVSPWVAWIEAVMLDVARKEIESLLDPERR